MKALSLSVHEFVHCHDDLRWARMVALVLEAIGRPSFEAVIVGHVPFSVIPEDLLPPTAKGIESILRLEHGPTEGLRVLNSPLPGWEAVCLALVPEPLMAVLPSGRVLPELCGWLPSLRRSSAPYHAHLLLHEHSFVLAVLDGRQPLLVNTFHHQAPEDVLYFTLAALEQLNILHSEAMLTLYGHVREEDGVTGLFQRYIPTVSFGELPTELSYSYSFKNLEAHRLITLLNAPLCA